MVAGGRGGSVVNIGSMWAHQAVAATASSAHSMAKSGLHALTHNLAIELADRHIRVNAVAPAVVATPIYEAFIPPDKVDNLISSSWDQPAWHGHNRATQQTRLRWCVWRRRHQAQAKTSHYRRRDHPTHQPTSA
jgi:NAD(P)-dependent dehydrogenase (short-subunit alcohol dehydrogenase family)